MTPTLQPESKLPALVELSGALAAGEITMREYNGAQRVAAMEDSAKKPFYKATWADVQTGDIVLMSWPSLDRIVEIEITRYVITPISGGKLLVAVTYAAFDGLEFGRAFDPDETVYVRSRP